MGLFDHLCGQYYSPPWICYPKQEKELRWKKSTRCQWAGLNNWIAGGREEPTLQFDHRSIQWKTISIPLELTDNFRDNLKGLLNCNPMKSIWTKVILGAFPHSRLWRIDTVMDSVTQLGVACLFLMQRCLERWYDKFGWQSLAVWPCDYSCLPGLQWRESKAGLWLPRLSEGRYFCFSPGKAYDIYVISFLNPSLDGFGGGRMKTGGRIFP